MYFLSWDNAVEYLFIYNMFVTFFVHLLLIGHLGFSPFPLMSFLTTLHRAVCDWIPDLGDIGLYFQTLSFGFLYHHHSITNTNQILTPSQFAFGVCCCHDDLWSKYFFCTFTSVWSQALWPSLPTLIPSTLFCCTISFSGLCSASWILVYLTLVGDYDLVFPGMLDYSNIPVYRNCWLRPRQYHQSLSFLWVEILFHFTRDFR